MFDGFKLRERRKAHYVQWLLLPHVGKKIPSVADITGFSEENATPKRVARGVQDVVIAELENLLG